MEGPCHGCVCLHHGAKMLNMFKVAWAENRRLFRNFFSLSLVEFANCPGVPLKHAGVALAALMKEVLVTVTMFVALRKYGLDVFAASNKDAYSLEAVPQVGSWQPSAR